MSNPSCRPPLCPFNCCDESGSCPASKDQCENSPLRNPVWIYVVIGVLIACILILALVVLAIYRKRQQRMAEKRKALEQQNQRQTHQTVEIEMQRGEEVRVTPPKPKKNIYVYDREVIEEQPSKKTRSGTNSSQSSKKSSSSQKALQNPFERKKKLRQLLL